MAEGQQMSTRANVPQGTRQMNPTTGPRMDLKAAAEAYGLRLDLGEVMSMDGQRLYVTKAGLLRVAREQGVKGIKPEPVFELCDPAAGRWVFRCTVTTADGGEFSDWGHAGGDDKNPVARQAPMEMASTRATNRAIRLACSIGLTSIEELAEAQWEGMKHADPAQAEPAAAKPRRAAISAPKPDPKPDPTDKVKAFDAEVEAISKGGWSDPEADKSATADEDLAGL